VTGAFVRSFFTRKRGSRDFLGMEAPMDSESKSILIPRSIPRIVEFSFLGPSAIASLSSFFSPVVQGAKEPEGSCRLP
jgi:hypothetical protein